MKIKVNVLTVMILGLLGTSCTPGRGILVENAFIYNHVNGYGEVTPTTAFVLFEHELLDVVRYQVAYIACTCRGPEVNFWSVALVELGKEDGSLVFLSYDRDSTGRYTPGLYGDSYTMWDGTEVKALFDGFIASRLIGRTQAEINAIEPMHGQVDTFTGATVTPNNAVRMLQGLFVYHNQRYES